MTYPLIFEILIFVPLDTPLYKGFWQPVRASKLGPIKKLQNNSIFIRAPLNPNCYFAYLETDWW